MLELFEVRGTDYEMGVQIGRKFKDYLQKRIPSFDKMIAGYSAVIDTFQKKLEVQFPKLLQEIYGRADGAEISRSSYLLMLFPELYRNIEGCTTLFLKKADGEFLFAHNDDNEWFDLTNTALIKYCYDDNYIISYTMAERLSGSAFSFTSNGMVFSSNYIFGNNADLGNLSRYVVVRDIINCSNIDEALQKLRNTDVASPFSLNMLDLNTKRAVNVEKDVHNVYITEITDRYARSNHFHAKQGDNSTATADTLFRHKKANELIATLSPSTAKITDLVNILRYSTDVYNESIYKQYGAYTGVWQTDATLALDTADDFVAVYDYIGNSILKISRDGNLISQTEMDKFK